MAIEMATKIFFDFNMFTPFIEGGEKINGYTVLFFTGLLALFYFALAAIFRVLTTRTFPENTKSGSQSRENKFDTPSFVNKCISTVHSIISVSLAAYVLHSEYQWDIFILARNPSKHFGFTGPMLMNMVLELGYVVYDTVYILSNMNYKKPSSFDLLTLLHHVIISITFTQALFCPGGSAGCAIAVAWTLMGITTPFMNYKGMFDMLNMQESSIYLYNAAMFTIGYLLVRVIYNSAVVYIVYTVLFVFSWEVVAEKIAFSLVLSFAMAFLQYYWFYQLCVKIISHIKGEDKKLKTKGKDTKSQQ